MGIKSHAYNGSLLWEPGTIRKDDGEPYKVFTPFYRKGCLNAEKPRSPLSKPQNVNYISDRFQVGIDSIDLLPKVPWYRKFEPYWNIGEEGAEKQFKAFIDEGLSFYKDSAIFPQSHMYHVYHPTYILEKYQLIRYGIHFEVYVMINILTTFCSELGWREFSYSQLHHNPELPSKNLQSKFDNFPWKDNAISLKAWQTGNTGIPMVDAGMRELWQTGYMHNRVRMITGSFLVKNLQLHWRHGERWFGIHSLMQILLIIAPAGNGLPDVVQMQLLTFEFLIRLYRGRNLTAMVSMFVNIYRNCVFTK